MKSVSTLAQPQHIKHPTVKWWTQPSEGLSVSPAQEEPGSELEEQRPKERHQRKFQLHFKQISAQEPLLHCFSCSYGGERIHQGHLYITQNYFAFRSNVFGYITKILIPIVTIQDIRREKMAKIIPNTVNLRTQGGKYIFSFLRSRQSAYCVMVKLWKGSANSETPKITEDDVSVNDDGDDDDEGKSDDDASVSSSETFRVLIPIACITDTDRNITESRLEKPPLDKTPLEKIPLEKPRAAAAVTSSPGISQDASGQVLTSDFMLKLSVGLVVLLSLTSVYLMYRVNRLYLQSAKPPPLDESYDIYKKIFEWQTQMHKESASVLQEYLSSYFDRLSKVKRSLDVSSLRDVVEEEECKT